MKKKDILTLMKYRMCAIESNYGKKSGYDGTIDMLKNPLEDLKDIEDLKDAVLALDNEFAKLRQEREKRDTYLVSKTNVIQNIHCNHPIIFSEEGGIGFDNRCALCNKSVDSIEDRVRLMRFDPENDNAHNLVLTTYEEKRNEYKRLYGLVYEMLEPMDDEDEVDFTKLFNRGFEEYDIGEVKMTKSKPKVEVKKYQILILYGSNKITINGDIYLSKEIRFDKRVLEFLNKAYNCSYSRICSKEMDNSYGVRNYETIDELKEEINKVKEIGYDLVIDYTRLFDYKIVAGKINIIDVSLDLTKVFPNSIIIPVKTIKDEINLYEELKNILIKSKDGKVKKI